MNLDGTADSTFSTPVVNGAIYSEVSAIAIDYFSGKIFIGGFFDGVNGFNFGHIARLNPGGTLDTSCVSSTSGAVRDILWQIDGEIVIGGFIDQVWSHNTDDPNNEAGWHTHGLYKGGRVTLSGLTPGSVIWVRVRTVGLKGVMGAWSDPAQIRVV